ncbi:GH25 family lysozyme [Lactiplantibacillus mudanjiangensis]|uniref:Uncharacterized protein n=1 Tax=Lactiplantibacillus mudanjiangensis TaxID=1296538 RepID=A0A660DWZ6_9LACO|nr:GH25 family lysozyme [Lactiplantibacillus mudanjiangensis]VDG23646.1 FIG00744905: hypothetical protein [Lactobacillus zymae] [Lactiplantibacillus mudanjiangensis]VDG27788.1 FIG00744905: hypothetical protein [Lactobacillus zymae] [Lactiplantibacillus mudanjiangensis]
MKHLKIKLLLAMVAVMAAFSFGLKSNAQTLSKQSVPDISEFQNTLTKPTAKLLKGEAGGVILRTGYGENRKDNHIDANIRAATAAGLKYGVYQYGQFINAADAKSEAKATYNRAPHAQFYVNDAEEYTTTSGKYATAVKEWATQMKKLTNKPVILYSYRSFYNSYIKSSSGYDAKWIAAYQSGQPTPQDYALWQYTDSHYFTSIKQSADASRIVTSKHSAAWWFGNTVDKSKFTHGGYVKGEMVRVKEETKFYGTSTKIDPALTKTNLKVGAVKTVYTGTSNQVLTLYNGSVVIGQVRAQNIVASYYHASYVTKVKVTNSKGIYTYLGGKRQHFYKKGAMLKVSGYKTLKGYLRFVHTGHKTDLTTNKNFVKWIKN